jgi:hypothetical protein
LRTEANKIPWRAVRAASPGSPALLVGSPAINAGNPTGAATADQRGVARDAQIGAGPSCPEASSVITIAWGATRARTRLVNKVRHLLRRHKLQWQMPT